MTNPLSDTETDSTGPLEQSLRKGPREAKVIKEVYEWLKLGREAWEDADKRISLFLETPASKELSNYRSLQTDIAARDIEYLVKSHWQLCNLINTGRLTTDWGGGTSAIRKADFSIPQRHCTLGDLETLNRKTNASIPKEMTPAWFKTVWQVLADNSEEPIDFSWASRYTKKIPPQVSLRARAPDLDRVLGAEPLETDHEVRNALRARLAEPESLPNWQTSQQSVTQIGGNVTAWTSGASASDTFLPIPAHVTKVFKLMDPTFDPPGLPAEQSAWPLTTVRQGRADEEAEQANQETEQAPDPLSTDHSRRSDADVWEGRLRGR